MKKLLTLVLVLAMASSVWAVATGEIRVDPADAKDSYYPSEFITIEIVAEFPDAYGMTTGAGMLTISAITTDNGGTASSPALGTEIAAGYVQQPGTLVNAGGILVSDIAGDGGAMMGFVPNGESVWYFEFHIPDVPYSTIINIGADGVSMTNPFAGDKVTDLGVAEIHVIPEPMTIALLGLGGLFLRRRR